MLNRLPKPFQYAVYILIFLVGMAGGSQLMQLIRGTDVPADQENLINRPAPEFTLPDLNQVMHQRSEWDGKVLVLNFWASWCEPCRKETPLFIELQNQYGSSGLQFVGVAIDDAEKVRDFAARYGMNYPILVGAEDAMDITRHYGNRLAALPYTVVMDRKGRIQWIKRGETDRNQLETAIRDLL